MCGAPRESKSISEEVGAREMWAGAMAKHCAMRPFAQIASSHIALNIFKTTITVAIDDIA